MGASPSFQSAGPAPGSLDLPAATLADRLPHGMPQPFFAGGCVLAVMDATPEGKQAAWRGALLARDCGMPLHLVHAEPNVHAMASAQSHAHRLSHQVRHRLGVACTAEAVGPGLERWVTDLATDIGLLVLPHRRGNVLSECLFGTSAERFFQTVFVPTVVVKRPATSSYRRVLVPVDLDDHAALLIDAAGCISRSPRIRVLHVLNREPEQSLRLADVPEHALRAQRQRRSRDAYALLNREIARAGASERAAAVVSFGSAACRVLEVARASRAQLAVLGKRRWSLVEQLFTASVSTRLVSDGGADVLLLPLQDRDTGAPPLEAARPAQSGRDGFRGGGL